jgi:deoxyribodipyrimidine photo-lyase
LRNKVTLFWFRRDLRIHDNTGLTHALQGNFPVLPVFIFDTEILDRLSADDARVSFIYDRLQVLRGILQNEYGSSIAILHGKPDEVFQKLSEEYDLQAVYTNRDYEPYAGQRDQQVAEVLNSAGIPFHSFKDQVIFEKGEVVKDDGSPYVVFTPYKNRWKEQYRLHFNQNKAQIRMQQLLPDRDLPTLTLRDMGFRVSAIKVPEYNITEDVLRNYAKTRDYPALEGTSNLGPHLRFGTVSVRDVVKMASTMEDGIFWNELIWREFFMQILWHFPETTFRAFKKKYDRIPWRNAEAEFEKWKEGKTGYALVDAGMRQLNQTGCMHNRVRMLVASFLCKHLLIDWRWGEAYFAEKLLDFELSSNVGNWQWAAGSGVDAAPYFRIFNPMTQVSKFDKDELYIRKWVPEYGTESYPDKMIDHQVARKRCLQVYKAALD